MKRRSFVRKILLAPVAAAIATDLLFSQPEVELSVSPIYTHVDKERLFPMEEMIKKLKESGIKPIYKPTPTVNYAEPQD